MKQFLSYLKCVGYVLFIHAVTVLSTVLMLNFTSNSHQHIALLFFCLMLLILTPSYFFVKRNAQRPVIYLLVTAISHIIVSDAVLKISDALCKKPSWDSFGFAVTEILAGIFFISVLLIDIALMIYKKAHAQADAEKAAAKPLAVAFLAGALASLLLVSAGYLYTRKETVFNKIYASAPTRIEYVKNGECEMHCEKNLSAYAISSLAFVNGTYSGEISAEEYILINVRGTANIYIYPHEEGVIVKYSPRFGPSETYMNKGLEFEYYMQEIYSLTGQDG